MRLPNFAVLTGIIVFTAGIALADTPVPHQRLGLWQTAMTMVGRNFTTQSCIDAATEAQMSALTSQIRNKKCQSQQITHNRDGSWTSTSTCEFRPGVMRTSHTVITGDLNSKFNMVLRSDAASAPEMTAINTWLGPCKPGMKGGDIIMSNGTKMNVMDGEGGSH